VEARAALAAGGAAAWKENKKMFQRAEAAVHGSAELMNAMQGVKV